MSLEVYYQQDIRNALLAAEQASAAALQAAGGEDGFTRGYQEGYRRALITIALAFGLVPLGQRRSREWQLTFLSSAEGADPNVLVRPPHLCNSANATKLRHS